MAPSFCTTCRKILEEDGACLTCVPIEEEIPDTLRSYEHPDSVESGYAIKFAAEANTKSSKARSVIEEVPAPISPKKKMS